MRRRALYKKGGVPEEDKFKMTVSMAVAETMIIPATSVNDFWVDWGDGSAEEHITSVNPSHLYAVLGDYQIIIRGSMPILYFNNQGSKLNLISVEQSGNVGLTSGNRMFDGCSNLTNVDQFDLSGFQDVFIMFRGCSSLHSLPNVLDVSSVLNGGGMFQNCSSLINLPSVLDFNSCTASNSLFNNCTSLIVSPDILLPSVTNASFMYFGCSSLETVNVIHFEVVQSVPLLFSGCVKLLTVPNILDISTATATNSMFQNCYVLPSLPSVLDISNSKNTSNMFNKCVKLISLPAILDTSSATTTTGMFVRCDLVTQLPSVIDLSSAVNVNGMFNDMKVLANIPEIRNMNNLGVLTGSTVGMFDGCLLLTCIGGTIDTSNSSSTLSMFTDTPLLTVPNLTEQATIEAGASWTNPSTCGNVFNFILAGQSNAVGRNYDSLPFPTDLPSDGVIPNAQYFDDDNTWKDFELYMNYFNDTTSEARSVEYRIAKTITDSGGKVNLLKYAQGGTTLSSAWNPAGSGGYLVQGLEASAALSNKDYDALIWIQGESDASNQASADAYEQNLKDLITRVRVNINPDITFIIVKLNTNSGGGNYTYLSTVIAAMEATANDISNCILIEQPTVYPLGTDNVHYTPEGMDDVAEKILLEI